MKVKFISLASGSSGNCYYIGTEKYGILIDAGIAVRTIKKGLKEAGISMEMIRAVFVTHDHADHIKAVGGLGEKQNIPIYTTARIHEGINRSYCMTEKLYSSVRYLEKQQPMQLEDFHIESFEVPHDGTDNVGYCIEIGGKVFAFLTDLGEITPTAAEYIRKANYLILEAVHIYMQAATWFAWKQRLQKNLFQSLQSLIRYPSNLFSGILHSRMILR